MIHGQCRFVRVVKILSNKIIIFIMFTISDKNGSFGADSTLHRVLIKLCVLFNFIFINYV